MAPLAVEGSALLAEAAAVPGSLWQQQQQRALKPPIKPCPAVQGTVLSSRPFVAHNVRLAALLGQAPPAVPDSWVH